jgi:hypothetical protein
VAITYGFFNSVAGDRKYNAEQIGRYLQGIVSSGVYADSSTSLQVLANDGMAVEVQPGRAMLHYHYMENDSPLVLPLSAGGTLDRIDAIVARLDLTRRLCEIVVKQGTEASTPAAPAVTRTDTVKEYMLAQVRVPRLSSAITQANITDTRANKAVCGWVTGIIDQVDTSTLFKQWENAYNAAISEMDEALAAQQQTFREWYEALTDNYTDGTGLPIPTPAHAGKIPAVNETGDGYTLTEAAPAGYGLGGANEPIVRKLTADDNLDTIVANGWYWWADAPQNAPMTYCVMRTWAGLGEYFVQEIITGNIYHDNVIMRRFTKSGVSGWQPWEYENPPMITGEEYRTTERIDSKAVYKKKKTSGAILYRLDGETEWKSYHSADLLWTNGSPGMGYGATPITLTTMKNYSWLMITYRSHKDSAYYQRQFIPVVNQGNLGTSQRVRLETVMGGGYFRDVLISDNGLTITLSKKASNPDTTSNEYCTPMQIHGYNLT